MADVQHSALTDPQLHEPKGVASASANQVYLADGAGSGIWTDTHILKGYSGFASYQDTTYTSVSPLAVSAGVRTKLTCDGLGSLSDETQLPLDATSSLWSSSTNKITPIALDDAYDVRVEFKASPVGTGAYVTVELDIGGSIGIIASKTVSLIKGAVAHEVMIPFPIFCKNTFISNGCEIYVTPSSNTDIYGIQIVLFRTHRAV